VRRGEATAEVTATGVHTKFRAYGRTCPHSHVVSSQQKAVLRIVRNLAIFNGGVILLIGRMPGFMRCVERDHSAAADFRSCVSSRALPATFTLAAALGARALAKLGVLPTRLTAVDEAATIDVLCSDKTGTLTSTSFSHQRPSHARLR